MDLFEHKQIIKRWINSCDTSEQLDLLRDVIQEFVIKRFEGNVQAWELDEAKTELIDTLTERKIIVAATKTTINDTNTVPNEQDKEN
jgi:hypothetical protein